MLFVLSKLLWIIFRPSNLLFFLMVLGSAGVLSPWAWAWLWGKRILIASTIFVMVLTVFPLEFLASRLWKTEFPGRRKCPKGWMESSSSAA